MSTGNAGASPSPAAAREMAAIAALPQRIISAWAAQDPDAFAAVFAEDGSMMLPGVYCRGRDEIRAYMADAYAGKWRDTQVSGSPLEMRLLADGAAVMVSQGGVMAPGESTVTSEQAIRATWVAVKKDGQWQLAVYHNCPRDPE